MDHFQPVKGLEDVTTVDLGGLRSLSMPTCCVAPLEMPEALELEAFRLENNANRTQLPPPVRLLGPDPLIALLKSVGVRSSHLLLQFSPLDTVNLPIVDRLNAAIPVTAACFAYCHPLAAAALLDR